MGLRHGKSWVTRAYKQLMNDLQNKTAESLICDESKVRGTRYYTIEPIGGKWMDMEIWCLDTFGNPGSIWQETKNLTPEPAQRWYMNDRRFWFRLARDRDWFILKWS